MTQKLTIRDRMAVMDKVKLQDAALKAVSGLSRSAFCDKYDICQVSLCNALAYKNLPHAGRCLYIAECYEKEVPFSNLTQP